MKRIVAIAGIVIATVACQKATPDKTYAMKGTIVSRDAGSNQVTIDNEDIPGVMSPMTMPYDLRGAKVDSLPPDGTAIEATLHQHDDRFWVTDVKRKK